LVLPHHGVHPTHISTRDANEKIINATPFQPTKAPPKSYQLLVKTHKLTIFLTALPSDTVASLKKEVLSALTSGVNKVDEVPRVTREEDFEISRMTKEKAKQLQTRPPPEYVPLDTSLVVKTHLSNWEVLFLQFRNELGARSLPHNVYKIYLSPPGELMPVEVTHSSLTYEDEEESQNVSLADASSTSKGKRKAPAE
jgi:hypothetical protein